MYEKAVWRSEQVWLFGGEKNLLYLPGFKFRTVQPIVSQDMNWKFRENSSAEAHLLIFFSV